MDTPDMVPLYVTDPRPVRYGVKITTESVPWAQQFPRAYGLRTEIAAGDWAIRTGPDTDTDWIVYPAANVEAAPDEPSPSSEPI